jgi:hypothetical protein
LEGKSRARSGKVGTGFPSDRAPFKIGAPSGRLTGSHSA